MVLKKARRNALIIMNLLINSFLDLLLPRFCQSCSTKLTPELNIVCKNCLNSMSETSDEYLKSEFEKKFASENVIKDFFSPFLFHEKNTIQLLIHKLKYEKMFLTGIFLGELLGDKILTRREFKIDLILPVPLHSLKQAERGYNQSDFIAKGLSKKLKSKYDKTLLKRIRFTPSQTNFDSLERKENVREAFEIRNVKLIKGKNVCIVDDVITTGSTINECAKILNENGAANIYAVSVALP